MELVSNWRSVLTRAWSVWSMVLAALIEVASQMSPYLDEAIPGWVIAIVLAMGVAGRLFKQPELHDEK
jgi:hypothetical protein